MRSHCFRCETIVQRRPGRMLDVDALFLLLSNQVLNILLLVRALHAVRLHLLSDWLPPLYKGGCSTYSTPQGSIDLLFVLIYECAWRLVIYNFHFRPVLLSSFIPFRRCSYFFLFFSFFPSSFFSFSLYVHYLSVSPFPFTPCHVRCRDIKMTYGFPLCGISMTLVIVLTLGYWQSCVSPGTKIILHVLHGHEWDTAVGACKKCCWSCNGGSVSKVNFHFPKS